MSVLHSFKNRVNRLGTTANERATNQGIIDYNRYLRQAGTSTKVQITDVNEPCVTEKTKWVKCTIRDIAFNDQKAYDQKSLTVPLGTNISVGCYVKYQDVDMLIIYEEKQSIESHRTFILKRCNKTYKAIDDNGNIIQIPMVVTNLTLYSHGLKFGAYLTYENGKRNIIMGKNYITDKIDIGQRIFLTHKSTFVISHIDDFTTEGLYSYILLQTEKFSDDNIEKQITENQVEEQKKIEKAEKDKEKVLPKEAIQGDNEIVIGDTAEYKCDLKEEINWKIEYDNEDKEGFAELVPTGKNSCVVSIEGTGLFIGQTITLKAISEDKVIATKDIEVVGLF